MQPMNYMIDMGNPVASLGEGYKLGAGIRNDMQQQQEAERQRIAAEQQKQQQAAMMEELTNNPTADNYAKAMLYMPGAREQLKSSWELRNTATIQNDLNEAGQVYAALKSGSPDVAKQLIDTRLQALENSGAPEREVQAMRIMSQLVEKNPQMVAGMALASLQTAPGGEKILQAIGAGGKEQREQELQPMAVAKAGADAEAAASDAKTKAVKAKFAESDAVLDLQKKGWDIKKIEADIGIARENNRIAAMNAATNREGNELKRQELRMKLDEAITARDEKVRGKVAEAEGAMAQIDNTLSLVGEILSDEDTLRAASGTGAYRGAIPGTKSRTMAGKIDQLSNQLAAAKTDILKGPTSDKDIAFLKSIEANLDRYQDEDQLIKELKRIEKGMNDVRARQAAKYGMPNQPKPAQPGQPAPAPKIAVNPQTGEKLILRNGKWEPM